MRTGRHQDCTHRGKDIVRTQRAAPCYHKSHTLTLSPCGNITSPHSRWGTSPPPLYLSKGQPQPLAAGHCCIFRFPSSHALPHPSFPLLWSFHTPSTSGYLLLYLKVQWDCPPTYVPVPCHHFSSLVESTILLLLGLLCNPHPPVLEATGWGLHCSSERGLGRRQLLFPQPPGYVYTE